MNDKPEAPDVSDEREREIREAGMDGRIREGVNTIVRVETKRHETAEAEVARLRASHARLLEAAKAMVPFTARSKERADMVAAIADAESAPPADDLARRLPQGRGDAL